MLFDALGLAPFSDTFWSSTRQGGNPWGDDTYEPNPDLQALMATLTTGPVAVSDKRGATNATLVDMTSDANGRILKPDAPLVPSAGPARTGVPWATRALGDLPLGHPSNEGPPFLSARV